MLLPMQLISKLKLYHTSCRRIHTTPCAVIGVIDMLEYGGGFCLEYFRRVDLRQPLVQKFFDGHPYLGAGLLAFAPIKHQFSRLERGNNSLAVDFTFSRSASLNAICGLVKRSKRASSSSFSCSPTPRCSSSFRLLGKYHQLLEELLGVEAARIVGIDHRLEFFQIIHASAVEPHHGHELSRHLPLSFSFMVRLRPVLNFSARASKSISLRSIRCSSPKSSVSRGLYSLPWRWNCRAESSTCCMTREMSAGGVSATNFLGDDLHG